MPNFIKIGGTRRYGELYTSLTFLKYFFEDFSRASTEKNTQ